LAEILEKVKYLSCIESKGGFEDIHRIAQNVLLFVLETLKIVIEINIRASKIQNILCNIDFLPILRINICVAYEGGRERK
jgi:hypothetical protein